MRPAYPATDPPGSGQGAYERLLQSCNPTTHDVRVARDSPEQMLPSIQTVERYKTAIEIRWSRTGGRRSRNAARLGGSPRWSDACFWQLNVATLDARFATNPRGRPAPHSCLP